MKQYIIIIVMGGCCDRNGKQQQAQFLNEQKYMEMQKQFKRQKMSLINKELPEYKENTQQSQIVHNENISMQQHNPKALTNQSNMQASVLYPSVIYSKCSFTAVNQKLDKQGQMILYPPNKTSDPSSSLIWEIQNQGPNRLFKELDIQSSGGSAFFKTMPLVKRSTISYRDNPSLPYDSRIYVNEDKKSQIASHI